MLGVAVLIGGCDPRTDTRSSTKPSSPVELDFEVPDFQLTERSGRTVRRDDLAGKVWVAGFVFTRCTGPCPQVSATMARLQSELKLKETDGLRLVTFTVDPDRDRPQELKTYAESFRADPDRWLFLTGDEKTIHSLVQGGFKLSAVRKKDAQPGDEFDHSSRLAVVDRRGVIRATFPGVRSETSPQADEEFAAGLMQLKSKVAELLKE